MPVFTCRVSADKRSLNLDYLASLRHRLTSPLRESGTDGVREVIDVMTQYDLQRDDVDAIVELAQWPNMPNAMAGVDSKVGELRLPFTMICVHQLF